MELFLGRREVDTPHRRRRPSPLYGCPLSPLQEEEEEEVALAMELKLRMAE